MSELPDAFECPMCGGVGRVFNITEAINDAQTAGLIHLHPPDCDCEDCTAAFRADHPTRSPDSPDPNLPPLIASLYAECDGLRDVYARANMEEPPHVAARIAGIKFAIGRIKEHYRTIAPPRSPDSVRTPDLDVLRAALEQIDSACTVFLTMAAKYHPDGGPAPAWLDFIRERQAEARAALHPASPPQKGS
jgi:hypothetical protein